MIKAMRAPKPTMHSVSSRCAGVAKKGDAGNTTHSSSHSSDMTAVVTDMTA